MRAVCDPRTGCDDDVPGPPLAPPPLCPVHHGHVASSRDYGRTRFAYSPVGQPYGLPTATWTALRPAHMPAVATTNKARKRSPGRYPCARSDLSPISPVAQSTTVEDPSIRADYGTAARRAGPCVFDHLFGDVLARQVGHLRRTSTSTIGNCPDHRPVNADKWPMYGQPLVARPHDHRAQVSTHTSANPHGVDTSTAIHSPSSSMTARGMSLSAIPTSCPNGPV